MICHRNHVGDLPQSVLDSLPENQGHPVRHLCAGCAYLAGQTTAATDWRARVERLEEENRALRAELARRRA